MKNGGNILVVHPDEVVLGAIRGALVPFFNVFTATDIRSASRILQDYDLHVALVPARLPSMSALQFAESVRGSHPHLLVVAIAENEDTANLKHAVKSGKLFSYLKAEADTEEVVMALQTAVAHSRLRDDNHSLARELKRAVDDQTRIMELFKRYVPEQVVAQHLGRTDEDLLIGETRVVSVLFADIRNFTRMASRMTPSDVVAFLNDFWSIVSEPVVRHNGSVNKLIGDGMLAIFGAPVSHLDNQGNAVHAALDMIAALDKVNKLYRDILDEDVRIGIGINTGEVVVGNVGSMNHIEYTVIGDAVNVASRIESLTKSVPNSILVSADTFEAVADRFEAEPAGELAMNGSAAIPLWRVHDRRASNIRPIRPAFGRL